MSVAGIYEQAARLIVETLGQRYGDEVFKQPAYYAASRILFPLCACKSLARSVPDFIEAERKAKRHTFQELFWFAHCHQILFLTNNYPHASDSRLRSLSALSFLAHDGLAELLRKRMPSAFKMIGLPPAGERSEQAMVSYGRYCITPTSEERRLDAAWPAWRGSDDPVQTNLWIVTILTAEALRREFAWQDLYRLNLVLFAELAAWNKTILSEFDYDSCFIPEFSDELF